MRPYQLISDALVESWMLHAGWESRWVGVSLWFSAVSCVPGGHSLDTWLKTVNIRSLVSWMTSAPKSHETDLLWDTCMHTGPAAAHLPPSQPWEASQWLPGALLTPCSVFRKGLCLYNNSCLAWGDLRGSLFLITEDVWTCSECCPQLCYLVWLSAQLLPPSQVDPLGEGLGCFFSQWSQGEPT